MGVAAMFCPICNVVIYVAKIIDKLDYVGWSYVWDKKWENETMSLIRDKYLRQKLRYID